MCLCEYRAVRRAEETKIGDYEGWASAQTQLRFAFYSVFRADLTPRLFRTSPPGKLNLCVGIALQPTVKADVAVSDMKYAIYLRIGSKDTYQHSSTAKGFSIPRFQQHEACRSFSMSGSFVDGFLV